MNVKSIGRIVSTVAATVSTVGIITLAVAFGGGTQVGGIVAEDPPVTTTPPPSPDGNGWGHG